MNRILSLTALPSLSVALGLALALAGCTTSKQPPRPVVLHQQEAGLTLTEADANKEIAVPAGQTVTIRLADPGAASGRRWEERGGLPVGGVLAKVGNPNLSGDASATLTQTYFARHPGRHQIQWAKIKPGQEGDQPELVTFDVIVR